MPTCAIEPMAQCSTDSINHDSINQMLFAKHVDMVGVQSFWGSVQGCKAPIAEKTVFQDFKAS